MNRRVYYSSSLLFAAYLRRSDGSFDPYNIEANSKFRLRTRNADAFGSLCLVKMPFLFPPTRVMAEIKKLFIIPTSFLVSTQKIQLLKSSEVQSNIKIRFCRLGILQNYVSSCFKILCYTCMMGGWWYTICLCYISDPVVKKKIYQSIASAKD